MKSMLRPLLAACLLLFAPYVMAWSALGHRLVGELAERHLSAAARAQVDALLAGEPDPTLAGIAPWADTLRQSDADRFKHTSSWHYVNFPRNTCVYEAARDCPDGNCVIAQIERQSAVLADRSQPLAVRRDALKFLVHLVGDVHQPLHAGNRPDKGGNDYQISLRVDLQPESYARKDYVDGVMGTNLHSVWDYYILGEHKLDVQAYAEELDAAPWPTTTTAITAQDAPAWAGESCALLDSHQLYPAGHTLDRRYLDAQRPLAEQRVRQAAYRLAAVLNAALTD